MTRQTLGVMPGAWFVVSSIARAYRSAHTLKRFGAPIQRGFNEPFETFFCLVLDIFF
jgi:hypothetical protein